VTDVHAVADPNAGAEVDVHGTRDERVIAKRQQVHLPAPGDAQSPHHGGATADADPGRAQKAGAHTVQGERRDRRRDGAHDHRADVQFELFPSYSRGA